jgi:hypothetical protein
VHDDDIQQDTAGYDNKGREAPIQIFFSFSEFFHTAPPFLTEIILLSMLPCRQHQKPTSYARKEYYVNQL